MRIPTISLAAASALALSACASGGPPTRMELTSTLTGQQAVPGPGDLDGTGTFRANVNAEDGQICYELNARGIEPATAAHIHRGEAGSGGPPVVMLANPDANGRSQACAAVDRTLAAEMIARPHGFHVNVHNQPFPPGAIRGQLRGDPRRSRSRPRSAG